MQPHHWLVRCAASHVEMGIHSDDVPLRDVKLAFLGCMPRDVRAGDSVQTGVQNARRATRRAHRIPTAV